MGSLTNTKIKDTYPALLKATDNGELSATEKVITDGVGNNSTLSLGTNSATVAGTLAFGSLKDTGENITITKFVDEADGIASNDNDTTIPTSAAVKNYVDNAVVTEVDTLATVTARGNSSLIDIVVNGVNIGTGKGSLVDSTTTRVGSQALVDSTGVDNTAIGYTSLNNNDSGSYNAALGSRSLDSNTEGDYNTAIGYNSGDVITIGSENVYIGANTTASANNALNEIVIGANATGNGSNTATYGNASTTDHYFNGNIRAASTSPFYISDDGGNTRMGIFDNNFITFSAGNLERLRIQADGGIRIYDDGYITFNDNTTTPSDDAVIHRPADNTLAFVTNSAERVRIDSSGNIGIGKSNPSSIGYGKRLWISSTTGLEPEGQIYLEGSRSLTGQNVGAITFVNNGNLISAISGMTDSPNHLNSGLLRFVTFNNGIEGERMRILSNGNISLNGVVYGNTVGSPSRTLYIDSIGGIGGISSIRASKTNIKDVDNVNWIYDLNPVEFNYRKIDEDGNYTDEFCEDKTFGLIAEDTEPIADFLINYNEDENGAKEMKGIEYSRLITPMLKAIQELKAEIETLKAQING